MEKLKLVYPVKPAITTQKFGETRLLQYYKDNGINIIGHNGIDYGLVNGSGQPCFATHDGEIVFTGEDGSAGIGVVLRTLKTFEYKGEEAFYKTIYWHLLKNIPVKVGQIIKQGDIIGYCDNTGLSTGNHLHFGLKPQYQKEENWKWWNFEQDNGYMGAINPEPYFIPFHYDLVIGMHGVEKLQTFLNKLGFFNFGVTGFYGEITRDAVFEFQKKYIQLSWWEKYVMRGSKVGIKTRGALNKIWFE